MKTKLLILLAVTIPVVLLDQVTKLWIQTTLSMAGSIEILEHFFHIRHIRNVAGAFGSLSWMSMNVFIVLTILCIGFIGVLYYKLGPRQHGPAVGLALIEGGAIGNLIDRFRLGSVIDFIDVHYYSYHWPAFNIADSAITVGSIILALCIVRGKW